MTEAPPSDVKADTKKKKSAFRITSIIDPVKHESDEEDDSKDSNNEGGEEKAHISRFRTMNLQKPNPSIYRRGRWCVKEIYVVELKEGKDKTEKAKSTISVTSNESTGDNNRSITPHSDLSVENKICQSPSYFKLPQFDDVNIDFTEAYENQVAEFLSHARLAYTSYDSRIRTLTDRYDVLRDSYNVLFEQNRNLREENRLLREELRLYKT